MEFRYKKNKKNKCKPAQDCCELNKRNQGWFDENNTRISCKADRLTKIISWNIYKQVLFFNIIVCTFHPLVLQYLDPIGKKFIHSRYEFFSPNLKSMILFTNPSAQAGYDTRSIFKRSSTGLNSEFSFS